MASIAKLEHADSPARRKHLERIVKSQAVQDWARLDHTANYMATLTKQRDMEAEEIQARLENDEKPVSPGEQERFRGRRSALGDVTTYLREAQNAVGNCLREARENETALRSRESSNALTYTPPVWGDDWEEAARALANGGDPFDPKLYRAKAAVSKKPPNQAAKEALDKLHELGAEITVVSDAAAG